MKTIGEKLRIAREAQGRSVDDIALATRINRAFLADLEQGILPQLPETYLRAFIADYAREVGLDGAELLKELESTKPTLNAELTTYPTEKGMGVTAKGGDSYIHSTKITKTTGHRLRILSVIVIFILVGLIVSILLLRKENTRKPPNEISFSDVIKEQESKMNPTKNLTDSVVVKSMPLVHKDSLILDGIASESLWVRISIDDAPSMEYKIPKLNKKQWKARKSFLVSLGNAAGISFTLNGQRIGPLSATIRPLRNIVLNWETLTKFKSKSP
jgi:cytoskeletal protein RodZ